MAVVLVAWLAAPQTGTARASGILFQIEAGSAPLALNQFAAQAHVQLLFDYRAMTALKTLSLIHI